MSQSNERPEEPKCWERVDEGGVGGGSEANVKTRARNK